MKKYRSYVLLLLILAVALLGGCADVSYGRFVYADGRIVDVVEVYLDVNQLQSAGVNANDVLDKVQDDIDTYFFSNPATYLSMVVQTTENSANKGLSLEQKSYIVENISFDTEVDVAQGYVVATIEYTTDSVYSAYSQWISSQVQDSDDNSDDIIVEKGVFVHTVVQKTASVFGYIDTTYTQGNDSQAQELYEQYNTEFNNSQAFELSDINFTQMYFNEGQKIDTNADSVSTVFGYTLNYWDIDPEQNQLLEFYSYYPNVVSWYILAIGVAMFVVVIMLWRSFNKQRDKYKKIVGVD